MNLITIVQIIISVVLIGTIILQTRGTQLGMTFGGSGQSFRSKRGFEKFLYYVTIVFAVLFAAVSILALLPNVPGIPSSN